MTKSDQPSGSFLKRSGKTILTVLRSYFIVIGIIVTVMPILTLLTLSVSRSDEKVPDLSAEKPLSVKLNLDGPLTEQAPAMHEIMFRAMLDEKATLYLPDIRAALRRAGNDDRIAGLNIMLGSLSARLAELAELRRIIKRFKESGKPVNIFLQEPYNWNYYLASVADKITINPTASVIVPGPIFNLVYFGEALRKVGVDLEVLRAGKYKSAFEPMIQNQPSPETLEQYSEMERSLRMHLIESVAAGRGKDPNIVESWFKQAVFTPEDALAQGVVDELGYYVDSPHADKPKDDDDFLLSTYNATVGDERDPMEVDDSNGGIALIEAVGGIYLSDSGDASDGGIIPKKLVEELRWAAEDEEVKAVVFRVSSPGGSIVASDIIWHEVKQLGLKKPLVVSMGSVAASGGYYIAAPAKRILAEPTTITGSIGVIGMLANFEPFENKYGVSFHIITQTDRAAMFNPGQKSTSFDKALVGATIDEGYKTFISRVAEGRNIPAEKVHELAQGRVYTGLEAVSNGLVDQLGGLFDAFQTAKEFAGLDSNKLYPVLRFKRDDDLSALFKGPFKLLKFLGHSGLGSYLRGYILPPALQPQEKALRQLRHWQQVSSREGCLALWPGDVTSI